jgi:ribosomal protein L32
MDHHQHFDATDPSRGYVTSPQTLAALRDNEMLVRRGFKRATSRHHRRTWWTAIRRMLMGGFDPCPQCGHPAMANFAGYSARGTACPDCGWHKDVTLVVACDCGELVVVAR